MPAAGLSNECKAPLALCLSAVGERTVWPSIRGNKSPTAELRLSLGSGRFRYRRRLFMPARPFWLPRSKSPRDVVVNGPSSEK
jgi:hypothetical protein